MAQEAGIAAELMASGVTVLGRASYHKPAYYGQAFFALTAGLERAAKLTLVLDHARSSGGSFPKSSELRGYGHNLRSLLEKLDEIAVGAGSSEQLPRTIIHEAIIDVLTDFASNATRYYNLELITGEPRAKLLIGPVQAWDERVVSAVAASHYSTRRRKRDEARATAQQHLLGGKMMVRFHTESGAPIDSVYDASRRQSIADAAAPWIRMYVMQIARFVAHRVCDAADRAPAQLALPHFIEFFGIFFNSDAYFRSRATWSIYG